MSLIELKNIFMFFPVEKNRSMQAGYNINLSIASGDMIAVIGESGCGKSTLGKICLGIQKPSKGEILYNSENIWSKSFSWNKEKRSSVQVVHQDSFASLNPVRTIYQTLSAPLLMHKIAKNNKEAKERVSKLLEAVDLKPVEFFMEKYPFQLSGGQRQRVSIARATIFQPKVIVADEPVSAVDASLRLSILDLMKKLNEKHGIAFLYITHDLATARYFAPRGRLLVMYLGRIVESGIIEECIAKPIHPYLCALLQAIPKSNVKESKQKIELPLKSFDMPSASEPPLGCVFHPRCPYATKICEEKIPELEALKERKIACHHKEKLIEGTS